MRKDDIFTKIMLIDYASEISASINYHGYYYISPCRTSFLYFMFVNDSKFYKYLYRMDVSRRGITTRKTLILSLQEGGGERMWDDFFFTYKNFIFNIACKIGLGNEDAEDVVGTVFKEVYHQFKNNAELSFADQSFGGWLGNLVKWRAHDLIRLKKRRPQYFELTEDSLVCHDVPFEKIWAEEWDTKILGIALTKVNESPRNIQVYISLAIRELPISKVCKQFSISKSNAQTIRCRVKEKLIPILKRIQEGDV